MLYLLPPFALAHGSLSTPLPRNAFNTPLNTTAGSKQLIPSYFTNYYDCGSLNGTIIQKTSLLQSATWA